MKINNSHITTTAAYSQHSQQSQSESLRTWNQNQPNTEIPSDRVSLTEWEIRERFQKTSSIKNVEASNDSRVEKDQQTRIMQRVLEVLTGRKITVAKLGAENSENHTPQSSNGTGEGFEYSRQEHQAEMEESTYSASGTVNTADGKELSFSLDLSMSRAFIESTNLHIHGGEAPPEGPLIDPLVLNFTGSAAELTDTRFQFDLNADGKEENIPMLRPGNGYLVFDKNNDQKVNDGRELFGPSTGNGFKELAQFDSDNNNWLDENDPIFKKLSIWMKNTAESDHLTSLSSKGIEALYLKPESTPFTLTNSSNQQLGKVKETSFYLGRQVSPGVIQEIDIKV